MVWFQCEDCGDNLKKPKLPSHFRSCSARKLSCIDCGQTFGQESVQGHTQCITEAEKYGPKGGNALNGRTPTSHKSLKQQPNIDINVGLSERPPWFCSLCNTSATSKQTLLLHAEGKKHRAKARGFHAAKEKSKPTEVAVTDTKLPTENTKSSEVLENKHMEEPKTQDPVKVNTSQEILEAENATLQSNKKGKLDTFENGGLGKMGRDEAHSDGGNGEVIQSEKITESEIHLKQKEVEATSVEKIKWKKLITSALKSSPEGVVKMKKLKKIILKGLRESGISEDETQLTDMLEHKINSSSKFTVEKKYVRLAKG